MNRGLSQRSTARANMSLSLLLVVSVVLVIGSVEADYSQPDNQIGQRTLDLSTLKFVSVVARHGSRSPLSTFPKDCCPYNDLRYWPDGIGRLTNAGKSQAYALGQQLRSRYGGFINAQYYDNETIFQSNACDRDITSAQLMAAGLYPPKGYEIWNSALQWQPIAVWITDYDVSDTEDYCPKFRQEREKVMNDLSQKMYPENKEFFAKIATNMGIQESQVWSKISSLYQDVILLSDNGLPKIDWINADVMNKLFAIVSYKYQQEVVGTETMKQLIAGPVLKSLTEEFNNKTDGKLNPDRKMFVLACHDTTIVSVVGGLGIDERLIPDPASSLVFEIHSSDIGDIVQVLYFNHSTTAVPTLFEIPDCRHPCPLKNFTQAVSQTIALSNRDHCHIDSSSRSASFSAGSLGFISIFALLAAYCL